MGYTHYWYREAEISKENFSKIKTDFERMLPFFKEHELQLAGPMGSGKMHITENEISFNGKENCRHARNTSFGLKWPQKDSGGVTVDKGDLNIGNWFAGSTVSARICNGDCSYESFIFKRVDTIPYYKEPNEEGLYFNCCKTNYNPYDLVVNIFLIIAKKHLKERIRISSDGDLSDWFDGKLACQMILDYGMDFNLDE